MLTCPPTACQGLCDSAGACQEREAARPVASPCNQCDPIGFCNTSCAAPSTQCPPCNHDCNEGRACPARPASPHRADLDLPLVLAWIRREWIARAQLRRWYVTNRKAGFTRRRALVLAWKTTNPIASTRK